MDVVELLHTNDEDYANACSLDFSKLPNHYETFAPRGHHGNGLGRNDGSSASSRISTPELVERKLCIASLEYSLMTGPLLVSSFKQDRYGEPRANETPTSFYRTPTLTGNYVTLVAMARGLPDGTSHNNFRRQDTGKVESPPGGRT